MSQAPDTRPDPVVDTSSVRLTKVPSGGIAYTSAVRSRETDDGAVLPGLADVGYHETEHLMSAVARTYTGPAAGPPVPGPDTIPFTTRLLVRRPVDRARFSGRVVIEPFNTSRGVDRDVLWQQVEDLLLAQGDAWIGVTERTTAAAALQSYDAERYAGIDLPSNDVAWDLLRQVGALARTSDGGLLPDLSVTHLYLVGYSQSGCEAATFGSAFHDLTRTADGRAIYDGYFPAAHGASLTALSSGRARLPGLEQVPMRPLDVPVIDVETQTDVEGFSAPLSNGRIHDNPGSATVRRADSDAPGDLFRLYEVAGAPHTSAMAGCDGVPSSFPTAAFLRAGLAALVAWAERGVRPPYAPRIELAVDDVVSVSRTDAAGNARGGVRSPHLDQPLLTYFAHSGPGVMCALAGHQSALSPQALLARYGDLGAYLDGFAQRLDDVIDAGFLLEADRTALMTDHETLARQAFVPPTSEDR